jgi:hypothetical protein
MKSFGVLLHHMLSFSRVDFPVYPMVAIFPTITSGLFRPSALQILANLRNNDSPLSVTMGRRGNCTQSMNEAKKREQKEEGYRKTNLRRQGVLLLHECKELF